MKGIAKLGVKLTNVHAAGGIQMMQAALKGLTEGSNGEGTDVNCSYAAHFY